jgi:hypothetical protein
MSGNSDDPVVVALDEAVTSSDPDDAGWVALRVISLLLNELDPRPDSLVMARALAYALGNVIGAFSDQPGERFDAIVASLGKLALDHAHAARDAQERHARWRAN